MQRHQSHSGFGPDLRLWASLGVLFSFLPIALPGEAGASPPVIQKKPGYAPRLSDLLGANGMLTSDNLVAWRQIGFSWSRHPIPWHTVEPKKGNFNLARGMWGIDNNAAILFGKKNGLETLVLLDGTARWASTHPDVLHDKWDGNYYPARDISDWLNYVEKTVRHFSRPPYNVRFFQIWNEPTDAPIPDRSWKGTRDAHLAPTIGFRLCRTVDPTRKAIHRAL